MNNIFYAAEILYFSFYMTAISAAVPTSTMIRGVVLDVEDDAPIAVAQVFLLDRSGNQLRATVTDADGRFDFDLQYPGRFHLRAARIGYADVTTEAFDVLVGDVLQVEIRISTQPITLPPLTVIGERPPRVLDPWLERGGYYEREARYGGGFGQFLGVEELEKLPTRNVRDLFRMTPGLRPDYPGGRDMVITDRRGRRVCWYLNGRPLRGANPADIVTPSMLVAVEVYSRGVVPGDFTGHDRACNDRPVIGLWTGFREP